MRILIVSDIRLYREGLAAVLNLDERLQVVGTVSEIHDALDLMQRLRPQAVLFDMGSANALESVRAFTHVLPDTPIIALGVSEAPSDIVACAEAGISGYVCRAGSIDDVIQSLWSAQKRELVCSRSVAAALLHRVSILAADSTAAIKAKLTPRELEVARLIDEGCSNKEIAVELRIELSTAKNHVHNLLDKLSVRHRGQAAAVVRRLGLLRPARHLG
jgi:DNA-binding NarL/FixJ family response regulator